MTLPKKPLLAMVITFAGLIGVLYAASSTILLNSIRQAEEKHTRQAVTGVSSSFIQTQDDFNYRLADWSMWDDTYTFAQDANEDYIAENLTPEALTILDVNLALFVQPSGRLVYGTGVDIIHQRKILVPAALQAHLSPQNLLLQHPNPESSTTGILLLPEAPILISSRPILTNEGKGPSRGTLIFGRFLDAAFIAKLSRISRLPVSVYAVNDKKLPRDFQAVRDSLGDSIIVRPLSEQIIAGYTLIPDIYGKPAVILRVEVPREIYHQGQNSLRYLIASLLIAGLVFGGIILLLLQRLVLSQRKWQQSEEYRKLVAQASESIFLVDADTKQIMETNTAFENLLGLSPEVAHKLTLYDLIASERENIDCNLLILKENHQFTGEQQYRRQDGQIIDVEINANLISHDGREVFCIIVHDITKRKQIEKQLLHDAFLLLA